MAGSDRDPGAEINLYAVRVWTGSGWAFGPRFHGIDDVSGLVGGHFSGSREDAENLVVEGDSRRARVARWVPESRHRRAVAALVRVSEVPCVHDDEPWGASGDVMCCEECPGCRARTIALEALAGGKGE